MLLISLFVCFAQGKHQAFESVPMSLMRTFAMMLGEIDFLNTYVHSYNQRGGEGERTLPFPLVTFVILGVFMVFMPILLMNLLIGLAVGDIESVRRNAQLKRLAMQVENDFTPIPNSICTLIKNLHLKKYFSNYSIVKPRHKLRTS